MPLKSVGAFSFDKRFRFPTTTADVRFTPKRQASHAIDQLMAAKSKEGLQQLFVQHAHNDRPKQGRKCSPD